jgi:phage portal protein BeeE
MNNTVTYSCVNLIAADVTLIDCLNTYRSHGRKQAMAARTVPLLLNGEPC